MSMPLSSRGDGRRLARDVAVVLAIAAGFVVAIGSGYLWHGQTMPRAIGVLFVPAIAVCAVALVALTLRGIGYLREKARRAAQRPSRAQRLQLERQYQEDKRYRDAYTANRSRLVSCEHLQPIEQAMRAAGLAVSPLTEGNVETHQRDVDVAGLCRSIAIAECVQIVPFAHYERAVREMSTLIVCKQCDSTIFVYNPLAPDRGS